MRLACSVRHEGVVAMLFNGSSRDFRFAFGGVVPFEAFAGAWRNRLWRFTQRPGILIRSRLGLAVTALLFMVLLSPTQGRAAVVLHFCQTGSADLGVLVTRGDSGWLTGGHKGITGFHRVGAKSCFRDILQPYRSGEYIFAGTSSNGRIVPFEMRLSQRSSRDHQLRTGQICVPETVQSIGTVTMRSGAQLLPCRPDERPWPASLFVLARTRMENVTININVS